jgi:hypothetical protein
VTGRVCCKLLQAAGGGSSPAAEDGGSRTTAAGRPAGASPSPQGCSVCASVGATLVNLLWLDKGAAPPPGTPSTAWPSMVMLGAKIFGGTPQEQLLVMLLALASCHPVPGVCGCALCGRLVDPTAASAVRGRVGTLCSGCGAAWYCSDGCQRVAWEGGHKADDDAS